MAGIVVDTSVAAAAAALRLRVDQEPVGLAELDALAATHRLTAYDAMYLELALRRGLALATLDRELLATMRRAGVGRALP